MKFPAVCLIGLVSISLASPLNQRRGEVNTAAATVTTSASSDPGIYSSQPLVPILPSDIQSLANATISTAPTGVSAGSATSSSKIDIIPTAAPTTLLSAAVSSSSALTPIIPSSPPDSYPTGGALNPCQVFCETANFSQDVCLKNCQVIDGNAQINAPGKTFPPDGRAAASTSMSSITTASTSGPVIPTLSPIPTPANPPEQCKEFCKTDKISESTCLSNCQVIDGQVQVNAPGKAFPPVQEVSELVPIESNLPFFAIDPISKACDATCALREDYDGCMKSCLTRG